MKGLLSLGLSRLVSTSSTPSTGSTCSTRSFDEFVIYYFHQLGPRNLSKIVSVLLSASFERVGVSRMRDFRNLSCFKVSMKFYSFKRKECILNCEGVGQILAKIFVLFILIYEKNNKQKYLKIHLERNLL